MAPIRSWAEVDLVALCHNVNLIKKQVGPAVEMMAVVKADAYGHGAIPVCRALLQCGVNRLGVGDSTEALEIYHSLPRLTRILILGAIVAEEMQPVVAAGIETAVHSQERIKWLALEARRQRKKAFVHLKVDTGLGRLGVSPKMVLPLLEKIMETPYLELRGIFTHFSNPEDKEYTAEQLRCFQGVLKQIRRARLPLPPLHAAASAAIFQRAESHFDIVRPGISLYGINPGGLADVPLQPVLSLKSQIIYLKDVPAGKAIGYNRTYITGRKTRLAVLPIGYNDGYSCALSNRASVLLHSRRAPVVGRISMDYTTVDVTHIKGARVGDHVTLIGRDGTEYIGAEELARLATTIPYEIVCRLGKRIRRVYLEKAAQEAAG